MTDDRDDAAAGGGPWEPTEEVEPIEITEMSPPPNPPPLTAPTPAVEPAAATVSPTEVAPAAVTGAALPGAGVTGAALPPAGGVPAAVAAGPTAAATGATLGGTGDPLAPDKRPWPESAKVAVAILALLAILGAVGTIIGFSRSDDDDDVATDDTELAAAIERAEAAEGQAAELQTSVEALTADVDRLTLERDAAIEARDSLIAEGGPELERLQGEVERLEGEVEALGGELVVATEQIASLETQLEEASAGAEAFPIAIDPDLGTDPIDGSYSVTLTQISCVGLDLCGSRPSLGTASLGRAGDGSIRFTVPGVLDIPMVVVDGSLFGVADEQTLVGPCGDVPRNPALTMSIFPGSGEVDAEGATTLQTLSSTILIDAPEVEDCEVGRVWYSAQLTRTG